MRPGPFYQSQGFTIMEMLAATALTSLLMIGVLAVMTSIAREHRAAAIRSQRGIETELMELLRWDLANATRIESGADRLVLSGHGVLDPQTQQPSMPRPCVVVYQVRQVNGRSWLSRQQSAADQSVPPSVAMVGSGVRNMQVLPADASANTGVSAAADSLRVRLTWDDPARPGLDTLLVLR